MSLFSAFVAGHLFSPPRERLPVCRTVQRPADGLTNTGRFEKWLRGKCRRDNYAAGRPGAPHVPRRDRPPTRRGERRSSAARPVRTNARRADVTGRRRRAGNGGTIDNGRGGRARCRPSWKQRQQPRAVVEQRATTRRPWFNRYPGVFADGQRSRYDRTPRARPPRPKVSVPTARQNNIPRL